ncbi:hypothetical protein WR25_15860 isoform A [Diploscapter pachys]|uniref:CSD domain-containing protein n=1 Tax=Diploscapter pachys TaxID=2018661 RepID=A0A2A2LMC9_9BILA|nr:hypothetical protein WR25_15860 isoform A [Diploscapter pachys]
MSAASTVAEMIAKMTGTKLRDEEKKIGEDRPGEKLDGKTEAGKEGGNKGSDSDRKPRSNSQQGSGKPRLTREEREKMDEERLAKYAEEQQQKKVLEKGCKGTVKWFSIRNKYGFIERDEKGKDDVFVHQMAISNSKMKKYFYRTLEEGEPVEFDIVEGKNGPEAANVTGPEGEQVKGTRYRIVYVRGRNGNSRGVTRRGRKDTAKSDTSNGKETKGTGKGRRDKKEKEDKASGDNSAAVNDNTVQASV